MGPKQFWTVLFRNKFRSLSKLASRVFTVPTSSESSERIWSVFDFIHSRPRNRLSTDKVNKLVFVYTNSALLSKFERDMDFFQIALNGEDQDVSSDDGEE